MSGKEATLSSSGSLSPGRLLGYIGSVAAMRLVVKIAGFGEKMTLAYYFDLAALDAYTVAIGVPMMIYFCVRAVTSPTLLPMFVNRVRGGDAPGAWGQIHAWTLLFAGLTLPVALAGPLFSGQIASLLAPGFDPHQHDLCATMLRVTIPVSCLIGWLPIAESVLNANRKFVIPPASDLAMKIAMIATLVVLSKGIGMRAAAWGAAFGAAAAVAISAAGMWRSWKFRGAAPRYRDADFKGILLLMMAPGFSEVFSRFGSIAENIACSTLQLGSVAALELARKIVNMPLLIIPLASGTVLFTAFVELNQSVDKNAFSALFVASIKAMLFIFVPLTALTCVLAEPIVSAVYQRGKFDAESVALVSTLLIWLSPTMCLLSIEGIIMNHFFARKDLWTPAFVAVGSVLFKIFIIVVAMYFAGLGTVAAAIVVSRVIKIALLWRLLKSREDVAWSGVDTAAIGKILVASVFAALGAFVAYHTASSLVRATLTVRLGLLAFAAGTGLAAYLAVTYALGCKECRYLAHQLIRRRVPAPQSV